MRFPASVLIICSSLLYFTAALQPEVDLQYSTYVGTALPNGISQWLGMRFAAPPLGALRFAPPQDPLYNASVQLADTHGKLCVATGSAKVSNTMSEDCLFLDVYSPSNATTDSKMPVFFFIQGGGFNSDANPNLNGSGLIEAAEHSIVVVTFNYRVGPYGFITDGNLLSANNGLRDQRKALQWVQQYIAQFGGDPDHVVLGGDSAGAASISLHMTAYGGRNDGLFQAAAAESISFATVLTVGDSQYQFNNFSKALGCSNSNATEVIECLRSKTTAELQQQNFNIPYPINGQTTAPLYMWNPTIDGDIIRNVTYDSFADGAFLQNLPVIIGDDTNGGTVFTPKNTTTLQESDHFLTTQFPYLTSDEINTINELYPNQNQSACPAVGCYWRQVSDAYGQMRYMCPGLYISCAYANTSSSSSWHSWGNTQSWAYIYNVDDPKLVAEGYGVPHTIELNAIFGPDNVNGGAPASYYPGKLNAQVVPVIQAYWTSFIRTYNPNTYRYPGSAEWLPIYGGPGGQPSRLQFNTSGVTAMETVTPLQQERCCFFNSIGASIMQ